MATATAVPAVDRPVLKPSRSMTHPLRDPRSNGRRARVKQGEPFDPEELSRRLTAHLTEQKIRAERRREARAAKAALEENNGVYHHVPKVAAAAFERTTTPEVMRSVHKLAQPAIKAHLELLSLDDPNTGHQSTSLQKTQAMDQAILEREMLKNRNQFQWTHDLEEAAEADMERDLYKPPQRTFNSEFAHLRSSRHSRGAARPLSMGDVFWEEEEMRHSPPPKTKARPVHAIGAKDRTDWVQRDGDVDNAKKNHSTNPFLRKMESSWILTSKKEKVKQDRDEGVAGLHDSPPDGNKRSFLARFKRHPS